MSDTSITVSKSYRYWSTSIFPCPERDHRLPLYGSQLFSILPPSFAPVSNKRTVGGSNINPPSSGARRAPSSFVGVSRRAFFYFFLSVYSSFFFLYFVLLSFPLLLSPILFWLFPSFSFLFPFLSFLLFLVSSLLYYYPPLIQGNGCKLASFYCISLSFFGQMFF